MAGAAALVAEIRKVLGAYARNAKPESMATLKDLIGELDRSGGLKELGCDQNCPVCAWGDPEAKAWENRCRIFAFLELVEDQDPVRQGRGSALVQREARALLEAIDAVAAAG